jgi:hypothetical protein
MPMWERDEDKLLLLELYVHGRVRKRREQEEAWQWLSELSWTRRAARRHEMRLAPEHEATLAALLDQVWPEWREALQMLSERELAPTPAGWRRLQDMRRAEEVTGLPERLNRRTALSAVAPHSKAGLSTTRRAVLAGTAVTSDGIVRLRPPIGLRLLRGDRALDAGEIAAVLGEVTLTERALLDGTRLEGPITAVLCVENLGPYQDLHVPAGWLVAHVPGWDTAAARLLFSQLHAVPALHFGDLDPTGVKIFRHLEQLHPGLIWAVPEFWGEYVAARGLPCEWPEDLNLEGAPALVRELAARGLWLEQEAISLDPRLPAALEATVAGQAYGNGN